MDTPTNLLSLCRAADAAWSAAAEAPPADVLSAWKAASAASKAAFHAVCDWGRLADPIHASAIRERFSLAWQISIDRCAASRQAATMRRLASPLHVVAGGC